RYLIHDRDPLFTAEFLKMLADAGVQSVKLPPRSPNLNAHTERFVRTIKDSCLEPTRRLFLLPRPHPHRDANPGTVFPTLAPGGRLSRRQTIPGFRRSPEPGGEGHHPHGSPWFVEGYGDGAEGLRGESGREGPDSASPAKGIKCWVMDR